VKKMTGLQSAFSLIAKSKVMSKVIKTAGAGRAEFGAIRHDVRNFRIYK
jgi:hypothetical protein